MSLAPGNLLVEGDNQPVLQALVPEFKDRIQCVYLDPPYNTGVRRRGHQESSGYTDAFDSATWLQSMKTRLETIQLLISPKASFSPVGRTPAGCQQTALGRGFWKRSVRKSHRRASSSPFFFLHSQQGPLQKHRVHPLVLQKQKTPNFPRTTHSKIAGSGLPHVACESEST